MLCHPVGKFPTRDDALNVVYHFVVSEHNDGRDLVDPERKVKLLVGLCVYPMNGYAWHLLKYSIKKPFQDGYTARPVCRKNNEC